MSKTRKKANNPLDDDQFEAFLNESVSSSEASLDTGRMNKLLDNSNRSNKDWLMEEDEDDDDDDEDLAVLMGTGKQFLKATQSTPIDFGKKPSQPKPSFLQDDDHVNKNSFDGDLFAGVGKASTKHPGKDTLEEMADKEMFFKKLEQQMTSAPDYSYLNKELDSSDTLNLTKEPDLNNSVGEHDNVDTGKADDMEELGESPPIRGSGGIVKSMLSQVALDSLDSTFERKLNGSMDVVSGKDMKAIPEGTGERSFVPSKEEDLEREEDSQDEYDSVDAKPMNEGEEEEQCSENRQTGDTSTRGANGKTMTGLTDTSHDIEALENELIKIGGLESFGSSAAYTFQDTSALGSHKGTMSAAGSLVPNKTKNSLVESESALNQLFVPSKTGNRTKEPMSRVQQLNKLHGLPEKSSKQDTGHQKQPSVRFNDQNQEFDKSDSFPSDENVPAIDELGPWYNRAVVGSMNSGRDESYKKLDPAILKNKRGSPKQSSIKRSKKFSNIKSSGYGSKSPAVKLSAPKSLWSPDVRQNRSQSLQDATSFKSSKEYFEVEDHSFLSQRSSSQFHQISKSQASLLPEKSVMDSSFSALDRDVQQSEGATNWHEKWKQAVAQQVKIKDGLVSMEQKYVEEIENLKSEYEQRLLKLKQENYALSAKVESASKSRLKRLAAAKESETVDKSELAELELEMKEQEKLLAGYQAENEKLYEEMKKLRTSSKTAEDRFFKENQKLKTELANLREEMSSKDARLAAFYGDAEGRAVPAAAGAGRIAYLESELKSAKANEENWKAELDKGSKVKQDSEKQLRDEIANLKDQLVAMQSAHSVETKEMNENHRKEMDGMRKKLKWYAENQQILDKDVLVLKQKDEEVRLLRSKLEGIETEAGRKRLEVKMSQKERSVDAKKILDLQRQVKEMENIIKKRHPNSLPVLMWAASNIPNEAQTQSPAIEYLEGRIKKLEREIEDKDDESKRSVRALEQKYTAMKELLQPDGLPAPTHPLGRGVFNETPSDEEHEERISQLEDTIQKHELKDREVQVHPHTNATTLQRELDSVRERHRRKVADLEEMINELNKALAMFRNKGQQQGHVDRPTESKGTDNDSKNEIQNLQEKIVLLENDKCRLLNDLGKMTERLAHATVTLPLGQKQQSRVPAGKNNRQKNEKVERQLLPMDFDNLNPTKPEYRPDSFVERHISDVLNENSDLKSKFEAVCFELDRQKTMTQKVLVESEAKERGLREELGEMIKSLKSAHQIELQNILATHAAEQSTSRVAELHSRVTTQEVIIKHIHEQLAQSRIDGEKMAAVNIKNTALEAQIEKLEEELHEAKSAHSPQMRHFEALQEKISQMEQRHQHREKQLEQLMSQNRLLADEELNEETAKWKKVVETKSKEIDRFRVELDTILDILRELHRQGVVIPYKEQASFH